MPIYIVEKELYQPIFCVHLSRRMIVATYEKALTFVLPVGPVTEIHKVTPQSRRQPRSKQNSSSFATVLRAMMQAEDPEDAHEFDAYA